MYSYEKWYSHEKKGNHIWLLFPKVSSYCCFIVSAVALFVSFCLYKSFYRGDAKFDYFWLFDSGKLYLTLKRNLKCSYDIRSEIFLPSIFL